MKIAQQKWTQKDGWKELGSSDQNVTAQLVLCFGGRARIAEPQLYDTLKLRYPTAHIVMCSTAGEIFDTEMNEDSLSVTAIEFEKTTLQIVETTITEATQSEDKGKELAAKLASEDLVHAMVYSDGLKVNGTALVKGLTALLPKDISVTGGLVGDGADFKETLVGIDAVPTSGKIVLIGFYSSHLKVGYGSLGGWDTFGPERVITKSDHNVLYELDGKPALALYKEYLGEKAVELPASGLLFPLNLTVANGLGESTKVVRTLLGVNEQDHSMTFAGDLPEGSTVQLMKANFERLIDGAGEAANMSRTSLGSDPELAILISCIGRKLVLKERTEEELEAVRALVGDAKMAGFYSYGEICPTAATEKQCQLHNQTMTITVFTEK